MSTPTLSELFQPNKPTPYTTFMWGGYAIVQRQLATHLYLVEIQYCKASKNWRHEFLLLVFKSDSQDEICLMADRVPWENYPETVYAEEPLEQPTISPDAETSSAAPTPPGPSPPNNAFSSSSNSLFKSAEANDRVFVAAYGDRNDTKVLARGMHGDYAVLKHLKIPHGKVHAIHVAYIFRAIGTVCPSYKPMHGQCYWFARSVCEMALKVAGEPTVAPGGPAGEFKDYKAATWGPKIHKLWTEYEKGWSAKKVGFIICEIASFS